MYVHAPVSCRNSCSPRTQIHSMDASISDMFQSLDIDCNGSLCAGELQDFFTSRGAVFSEEHLRLLFDELDADGSGAVGVTAKLSDTLNV